MDRTYRFSGVKQLFEVVKQSYGDFFVFEGVHYNYMRFLEMERELEGGTYKFHFHFWPSLQRLYVTKVTLKHWALTESMRRTLSLDLFDMGVPDGEIVGDGSGGMLSWYGPWWCRANEGMQYFEPPWFPSRYDPGDYVYDGLDLDDSRINNGIFIRPSNLLNSTGDDDDDDDNDDSDDGSDDEDDEDDDDAVYHSDDSDYFDIDPSVTNYTDADYRNLPHYGSYGCYGIDNKRRWGTAEPDNAMVPFLRLREPQTPLGYWPTLIIESSLSASVRDLWTKMRWWFAASRGKVKIVLVVRANFRAKTMIISKYINMDDAPEVRFVLPRNLNNTDPLERYAVIGGPLVLEFEKMFLRPPIDHPERDERDVCFDKLGLAKIADFAFGLARD